MFALTLVQLFESSVFHEFFFHLLMNHRFDLKSAQATLNHYLERNIVL